MVLRVLCGEFASRIGIWLFSLALPAQSVPVALLFFNLGVEVGQLLFVAAMWVLGKLFQRFWLGQAAGALAMVLVR